MTGLLIFSFILITFHAFSLRAITRANNDEALLENSKRAEEMSLPDGKAEGISLSFLLPVLLIVFLSLVEIGYFVFAVYILKDYTVIIGSSILAGYNIYELIKFFPKLKILLKSPIAYFKEKSDTFDNVMNFSMAVIEILFCVYIIIKIVLKYNYF